MASVGSTLRSAREQRGLTIEQVAQDTRISQRFLEAIERDEFDALPAPVYVRGFIRSYSSYLRLDAAPLLADLALQGLGAAQSATQAYPPVQQGSPPGQGPAEERRPVDPFARSTSPRAPEPGPVPQPPPPPTERASAPPPPPPRPAAPPGRPTPPPPIPPDALDDDFAREPAPFLRPGDEDQRSGRIFAIVAAVFFGILGVGALAFVFTRGGDGDEATFVTDTPTPRTDASVVAVPTGTRSTTPGSGSPAASASPATTGTPGTPGTPAATQTQGSSSGEPTPTVASSGSTPGSTETSVPTSLPTQVPTSIPTPVPTPAPTVTPFPTPTATATVIIISHPYQFNECIAGDCGPQPRRVVCAPDGWFVDVGYDWGPIPLGWRETLVEGTAKDIEDVGDRGCI